LAMKHNNQLPNAHFHKQWQTRVKTWLDQAGRKKSRRSARIAKAQRVAPRPTESLRPAVRCPTLKHNTRLRAGRGFTLEEIKSVGLTAAYARSIGISVDPRRRNKCEESLLLNKQRLQAYLARLVIFPKNAKAPKKNECSDPAVLAAAGQVSVSAAFPITQDDSLEPARKATDAEKQSSAYLSLRKAWNLQRYAGIRAKRAAEKSEAEKK